MSNSRYEVDRFDGTGDFSLWKVRMLAHFGVLGLKSILTDDKLLKNPALTKEELEAVQKDPHKGKDGVTELAPEIDPAKFEKSEKAKDLIVLNVGNQVLRKISNCETAADMWSTLNKLYMETSLPNRIYLQLKFYTFKMNDSKSIDENVDDFLKLVADLNNLGVEVSEEVQAILLMSSLPYKYAQLKETLKYGRDTLKLNEVTGAAKSKERELLESGPTSQGQGLYVDARGRSENRFSKENNQQGGGKSKNRGRSQSGPKYNNNTGCFICGSDDHWKRDCPERKKSKESVNIAVEPKQPIMLTVSKHDTLQEWVMDSGCTYHSTSDKNVLFDFKELNGEKVLMANNTEGDIKGIGKIRIQNSDGSEVILKDVRYIPQVSRNLISYGMLEKSGCRYEGKEYMVHFYKDNKKVISGKYHKGLYYLQGTVSKSEKNVSRVEDGVIKKKSKKVTFSENLVQGPTPHGFKKRGSSIQGGESGNSGKVEFKDSGCVAYALATTEDIDGKVKTCEEVIESKTKKHWKDAKEDMESLRETKRIVSSKWYFKQRPGIPGIVENQEVQARVIAKGFSHQVGIKSDGIFRRDNDPKVGTSKIRADIAREAVPGHGFQVCCDPVNLA